MTFANVFYTIENNLSDIWYVEVGGGAYGLRLAEGNYGGTELAAEMQLRLHTVNAGATVTYVSKTGRLQIVMSGGRTIKVWSDQELTNAQNRNVWLSKSPSFNYSLENPCR